jgi:general secretion pathway protein M
MGLADWWANLDLNRREQRNAIVAASVLGGLVFLSFPAALVWYTVTLRDETTELRDALEKVQSSRGSVLERKLKKDAIAARYRDKAPALDSFLEERAREQKLELSDAVGRPEVAIGKRYTERTTVVHLKKAGMGPISRWLEAILTSGKPVIVSRLNLRRRTGEPDAYDVEVGVAAYDRSEQPKAEKGKAEKGEKGGSGDKGSETASKKEGSR